MNAARLSCRAAGIGMGAGNGDRDVPQREPGLSVPFSEALPAPLRGSDGEISWALMVFMLAGEQGELGCTWQAAAGIPSQFSPAVGLGALCRGCWALRATGIWQR